MNNMNPNRILKQKPSDELNLKRDTFFKNQFSKILSKFYFNCINQLYQIGARNAKAKEMVDNEMQVNGNIKDNDKLPTSPTII